MKLKITIILILVIALIGCASLKSGPQKLPRCNGQNVRVLNQGKWNKWSWDDQNVLQHNTAVKPVPRAIILNTLENEIPKAHVELNTPPVDSIKHQAPSYKNAEITDEK
ncbi:Type IV secretion system protein VirB7, 15 kDa Antigen [Bartonella clarridgeiae 73]|uniref:Type IV secretion system protein VirB7, 15 kDa Antigen n=1 Tax=Bartonella clarridgeiae (strain CCUG 45776 / CIP 104772 / 73) TaxID=696125 RepID=E6YFW8_BARC7|nr:hypothetical protein [Bartonella clarridgeiae]WCR55098.1 MAG: type IV secretion system protein VirB7 15 kDa Antigen [Bartonella clarridgeiae]WCR55118.1 MAG: type IV secretion system protein VirB7 15 kDa Antigen [Bartonella clarridgeiae]WCR55634.1 MAG: type IV secretion system protein VirB7 15 kDa Antigen [Bartonella clarridgeiae]CBI75756.1 Type IV secretion system protein VirB7, 15 kDa Antigen [Bartonella clarridgeiae 73]CBI76305.1 Type IV secretion system protein VirB7, 15 kDa Antigen [Bar